MPELTDLEFVLSLINDLETANIVYLIDSAGHDTTEEENAIKESHNKLREEAKKRFGELLNVARLRSCGIHHIPISTKGNQPHAQR